MSFRKTEFSFNNRICKDTQVNNSSIGSFSYIGWNSILNNVQIGSFCSIAPFVEVVYGRHPLDFVSTHPIFYSSRKQCGISFLKKNIIDEFAYVKNTKKSVLIENDVWIGYGVRILEGVTIKNGSVVLAGSMVVKDVEPYSVVGGVPAKHIKYRFDKEIIEKFLKLKWWDYEIDWIEKNIHKFLDINQFLNNERNNI